MIADSGRSVAFTGHRTYDGTAAESLSAAVERLYGRGFRTFLSGMAVGFDLAAAEAVLTLRDTGELEGAKFTAMLPCPSQADRWSTQDRARYRALLARCDEAKLLEAVYTSGCMLRRNRAMVDAADALLTVFDGSEGGTAATIRYAKRCGVEIVPLWL